MQQRVGSVQDRSRSGITVFFGVIDLKDVKHFVGNKQVLKKGVEFSQFLLGTDGINRHSET